MIGDQLGMHSTCSDLLACWTVMPHNANASVNAQDPLHASIFPSIPFLRTSSLIILSLVTEIRLEALLSVCVLLLFLFFVNLPVVKTYDSAISDYYGRIRQKWVNKCLM